MEEAYKYLHPGSRSTSTLEHMLYRLVTVLAQEFLQWELISSLPCKLLLSILAKKLLIIIDTISCPNWLIENMLILLEAPLNKVDSVIAPVKQNINVNFNNNIIYSNTHTRTHTHTNTHTHTHTHTHTQCVRDTYNLIF